MNRLLLIVFTLWIGMPAVGADIKKKEPLFGKKHQEYTVTSSELKGAVFYLVSGHGGPDPGCIGYYQGKELHEDEYAYDIILRLGKKLLEHGAKVHFIITDAKDGIRDSYVLNNSKREKCGGKQIPLNQLDRLKQRSETINALYKKDKSSYKRAVFIHVDSRARKNQIDVFFYHAPNSIYGKRLATGIQDMFRAKYKKFQPNRGFDGEVSERGLYVLQNTQPVGVFIEVGNIQNSLDQKRLVIPSNREALAKWIADAIVVDHKKGKAAR